MGNGTWALLCSDDDGEEDDKVQAQGEGEREVGSAGGKVPGWGAALGSITSLPDPPQPSPSCAEPRQQQAAAAAGVVEAAPGAESREGGPAQAMAAQEANTGSVKSPLRQGLASPTDFWHPEGSPSPVRGGTGGKVLLHTTDSDRHIQVGRDLRTIGVMRPNIWSY